MGYSFTDLGAEGCRRSLNALLYSVMNLSKYCAFCSKDSYVLPLLSSFPKFIKCIKLKQNFTVLIYSTIIWSIPLHGFAYGIWPSSSLNLKHRCLILFSTVRHVIYLCSWVKLCISWVKGLLEIDHVAKLYTVSIEYKWLVLLKAVICHMFLSDI